MRFQFFTLLMLAFFLSAGFSCKSNPRMVILNESLTQGPSSVNANGSGEITVRFQVTTEVGVPTPHAAASRPMTLKIQTTSQDQLTGSNWIDFAGLAQHHWPLIHSDTNAFDFMRYEGYISSFDGIDLSGSQKHWASFIRVQTPSRSNFPGAGPFSVKHLYYGAVKGPEDKVYLLYGDQIHGITTNQFIEEDQRFRSRYAHLGGSEMPSMNFMATFTESFDQAYGGLGLYQILGSYLVRQKMFQEIYGFNLNLTEIFYQAQSDTIKSYLPADFSRLDANDRARAYTKAGGTMTKDLYSQQNTYPFTMFYHDPTSSTGLPQLGLAFIGTICNQGANGQKYSGGIFNSIWVRPYLNVIGSNSNVSSQYILDAHENLHIFGAQHSEDVNDGIAGAFDLMLKTLRAREVSWVVSDKNNSLILDELSKVNNLHNGYCNLPTY